MFAMFLSIKTRLMSIRNTLSFLILLNRYQLFDKDYFLSQIHDPGPKNKQLFYLSCIYLLNREYWEYSPHPLFDVEYYNSIYPDVKKACVNPYLHYMLLGWKEKRLPHAFIDFDQINNVSQNPIIEYVSNRDHWDKPLAPLVDYKKYFRVNCAAVDEPLMVRIFRKKDFETYLVPKIECPRPDGSKRSLIIVSHDASRTGAPFILLDLAKYMAEVYNFNCVMIFGKGGPLLDEFKKYGHVIVLNRPERIVYVELDSGDYPIALCNSLESVEIISKLAELQIHTVTLVHEFAWKYPVEVLEKVFSASNQVVFPAQAVKYAAERYLSDSLNHVIPQGLLEYDGFDGGYADARCSLSEELNIPQDGFVFLGCGYVHQRKGCDHFVDIAVRFMREHPDKKCYFLWVGDFDYSGDAEFNDGIKKKIENNRLENIIKFIGQRDDTSVYFKGANTFLMTSREDPFPCVVLEAMKNRLPIVTFANTIGSEDLVKSAGGFVVDIEDTGKMISILETLYDDENMRESIGKKSERIIETEYKFSDYAAKIYEKLPSYQILSNRQQETWLKVNP